MSTAVNEREVQEEKALAKEPSFNLKQFMGEVREEFLKITWPSRQQVTREFFSVLLLVAALTGIIFIIDKVFKVVVDFFTGRLF